ncbi:MAG TPA: helix-turn-helix domain-containing protein [Acidimicrobiales bacterium]|nr:helix-turn-helix domain-containing protein [Acidimicrobiales bacterium]
MLSMETSATEARPLAYGIEGACEATDLSRPMLYRLMKNGQIPYRRCGGRRLILAADLQRWLESLPKGSA